MERQNSLSLIILLIFGIISSCYYDNEQELYPTPVVCDTTQLVYDGKISAIINSKCATPACHGGTQIPNLSDFVRVKANINRIKTRAIDQKTMPLASAVPLTDCELQQLELWINNGSPQN